MQLAGPQVTTKSGKDPRQLVVFLHGYGANGDDLIDLSYRWQELLPDAAFVSPHAPDPCDANPEGRQWFGLMDFSSLNVRSGLNKIRPVLTKYLKQLLHEYKLEPENLALVGFSQGTILALEMIFAMPNLGCVIGYSGAFYPPIQPIKDFQSTTKVLLVHGTSDMVVPYPALYQAESGLAFHGIKAQTLSCRGLGHSIDNAGLLAGGDTLYNAFH